MSPNGAKTPKPANPVIRGADWKRSGDWDLRSAWRDYDQPGTRTDWLGFRVVLVPSAQ
jgi:formylglycine-generating enzyme required for sulfatase activity